jgi:hypothetical protein
MTYIEAEELSLTVEWKTTTCSEGSECWCRIITPTEPIVDNDGNEVYIAGSGAIPTIYAEHIVKLHNESLKQTEK